MSLFDLSVVALQEQLKTGAVHPRELVTALAEKVAAEDPSVGAFLSLDVEDALRQAEIADVSLPLGGIPVAIKDNINVLDQPCTCGSRFLAKNYRSPYDAGVIDRLRAAGAVLFGRTNMDEFAMGSATENSALAVTQNPAAPGHIPGGSSGGSAAAVAARFVPAALGSDTGGSIRQPASHCGVVGLKPTYGRVSRYGLVAFASSLDQIGPITRNVSDAAVLLQAIMGHDERDSTSLNLPVPSMTATLQAGVKGMKLGLPREYLAQGTDPAVRSALERALVQLSGMGAEIVDISLPHTEHAVATYYILAPAEASSNLSRFDGVRYGQRAAVQDVLELYQQSREAGFGAEVKRRIILGTYVLSSGYYDAYYGRAQKVRTLIRRDFEQAFAQVDAIIAPVAPSPARLLGSATADPLQEYLADACTIPVNLAGLPAISVPLAVAGLPIGLQIVTPALEEARLLQVAYAVEQAQQG